MRIFAQKPKTTQQTTSAKSTIPGRVHFGQSRKVDSMLRLQRTIGNHTVLRLMQAKGEGQEGSSLTNTSSNFTHDSSRIPIHAGTHATIQQDLQLNSAVQPGRRACAAIPVGVPTAMLDQRKTDTEVFEGEIIMNDHGATDQTAFSLNEDGFIDGEWTSEVVPHVFTNGGKTGTAIVHWAGGSGGTGNQGLGSITLSAPVIDTSAPAAGQTAKAWVRTGTGTATVTRSYIGVLTGANGANNYFTARAAVRVDVHEALHVTSSGRHHNASITPLEARVAQHTGHTNPLRSGTTEAAARTALTNFLNWNGTIASFRTADTADNTPGGTVDTIDMASANFIRDYGPRKVGAVNYANYYDTPPGP